MTQLKDWEECMLSLKQGN